MIDKYLPGRARFFALTVLTSLLLLACSDDERVKTKPAESPGTEIALQQKVEFASEVLPLLEQRCVHCHACYDAPCQLLLSSPAGIDRGAHVEKIYDSSRITAAQPSRLFLDAQSTEQWRDRGFFPVIPVSEKSTDSAEHDNLIAQVLRHKADNPIQVNSAGRLPKEFDLSLNRDWNCPTSSEYQSYAEENPLAGMPFALPALAADESATLNAWLAAGAPMSITLPDLSHYQNEISAWEQLLNRESLKGQLVARYIFEHLYLASFHFGNSTGQDYFKLVRSSTPPGEPVRIVATRRPFDDPGSKRIFYRLQYKTDSVVAKTHMPYLLDPQRLQRFQQLFFNREYPVKQLPGYALAQASNPFITFRQIPVESRYRFMLEHAEFTIRGFMKGAVCRGQVALNVIDDQFWVFFVSPEHDVLSQLDSLISDKPEYLSLPALAGSESEPLANWLRFSRQQRDYLTGKSAIINDNIASHGQLDLNYIWDGDGNNSNAALTVLRHFDSASVRKGLYGDTPKTIWLIDYPVLERIHYLLVAGFDVYGNFSHQLLTRLYMDFLRMESEFTYLTLLPIEQRKQLSDYWYREASDDINAYLHGEHARVIHQPAIDYKSNDAKSELMQMIRKRLASVLNKKHQIETTRLTDLTINSLQRITNVRGKAASLMPESSLLLVNGKQPTLISLLRNSAHSNVSIPFAEASRRLPDEDSLIVMSGVVGAYPDALWQIDAEQLESYALRISKLENEGDYQKLMQDYGVRRTNPRFWTFSDRVHEIYRQVDPIGYGLLDYSRLENR